MVQYPIKANDWLTVAFNNHVFFEKSRKERLAAETHTTHDIVLKCKCPACVGNWNRIEALVALPIYLMRYSSEEAIIKNREYCDEINKPRKSLDGNDDLLWFAINYFRWNLMSIGRASFWDNIPPSNFSDPFEEIAAFLKNRN